MSFVNDGSIREALLSSAREAVQTQRRRLSEVRAREHVGAAGWAQSSALESILRAGREGLAATDALKQVVFLTSEQLRTLPMKAVTEQRQGHLAALNDIVESSTEQLTSAQALDQFICEALEDVATVPLDELNIQRLKIIHARLQEQVSALNTIMEAARVQAQTLEQVAELERITAQHQQRVTAIRQFSAEEELSVLSEAGQDIVNRITQLDEAHPQQLDALEQIGTALVEHLPDTGAKPEEQVRTLEHIAQVAQDKADELRAVSDEAAGGKR